MYESRKYVGWIPVAGNDPLKGENTMNPTNREITSTVDLALAKIKRQFTQPGRWLLLFLFVMCFTAVCTTQARAQALGADNNRRYDQNAYLESIATREKVSANNSTTAFVLST